MISSIASISKYSALLFIYSLHGVNAQTELISLGSFWKYLDDGSDQGTSWIAPTFNDSSWASGPAQLGYGDGDEATELSYGGNSSDKFITTYFRRDFEVADASTVEGLLLEIQRDDGAVVYLNGVEVFRSNMPTGPISSTTTASTAIGGAAESALYSTSVSPSVLMTGTNIVAVEIHQANSTSSDISFDLRLSQTAGVAVIRGPYLQRASASGMTVRWRTDIATDSVVRFGTSADNLDETATASGLTTEHVVSIGALSPATRYYYNVGDRTKVYASGPDYYFVTHPVPGTARATRLWVLGDSGTANADAAAVRDAYIGVNGDAHADVWLMLGDNAYNDGTDSEYEAAVFDMYPATLRNSVLWSTLGNHDGHTADSATQSGPYYDIFTFPTTAESGGMASGTEAYYSFDYANLHFVCLDSYETSRSSNGAMATWLQNDLAATTQEWIIAFWHHPPYSKGSHNSDTETNLIDMREVFVPIFESYGVDLVLCGHSHSYERSMLIDGHHGSSGTFDASMVVDGGDGDPGSDGEYVKQPIPHDGAVYAVAGSSGKISGGSLNHPIMVTNLNELGSMIIDVNGNALEARFINNSGDVRDVFRIRHDPGSTLPPAAPSALGATAISSSAIELAWTDNATDETGFAVERSLDMNSWIHVANLGADTEFYTDSGLTDDTLYHYRVSAFNMAGSSDYSDVASATTEVAPPYVDQYALSETAVQGTVSGTYHNTFADDDVAEAIQEAESNGNPAKRRSRLEHRWTFNVQAGMAVTLHGNVWSSGSADNDAFAFDYSTNGGASWSHAFSVTSEDPPNLEAALLTVPTGGEVVVRVTDTDDQQGNNLLDTIFVDELYIRTDTEPGDPPIAPSALTAAASSSDQIDLTWSDNADNELGFEIERLTGSDSAWVLIATVGPDSMGYLDESVQPSTSYSYKVRAFNASGTSAYSNTAMESTPAAPPGIELAASGYKVKGRVYADLVWSGASGTNVDIMRNGVLIATVSNDGAYTDDTGERNGNFSYQVCESGGSGVCSESVPISF